MTKLIRGRPIVVGLAIIALAIAVTLTLVFQGEASPEGTPLDDSLKSKLQSTNLDFIADTGRIVTNESGEQKIIWDPPELPTLEDSIINYEAAMEANDTDLLPLCTDEFRQHMKAQKAEGGELTNTSMTDSKPPAFPICRAIPDQIGIGDPGAPLMTSPESHHTGYNYHGSVASEGINGVISRMNPALNTGEWAASRFLAVKTENNVSSWLEGGWAEYEDVFDDQYQHVYTQACDSNSSA